MVVLLTGHRFPFAIRIEMVSELLLVGSRGLLVALSLVRIGFEYEQYT